MPVPEEKRVCDNFLDLNGTCRNTAVLQQVRDDSPFIDYFCADCVSEVAERAGGDTSKEVTVEVDSSYLETLNVLILVCRLFREEPDNLGAFVRERAGMAMER